MTNKIDQLSKIAKINSGRLIIAFYGNKSFWKVELKCESINFQKKHFEYSLNSALEKMIIDYDKYIIS